MRNFGYGRSKFDHEKNMPDHFYTLADQMKYSPEAATEMRDEARDLEKNIRKVSKKLSSAHSMIGFFVSLEILWGL